jgi:hypothetical protein
MLPARSSREGTARVAVRVNDNVGDATPADTRSVLYSLSAEAGPARERPGGASWSTEMSSDGCGLTKLCVREQPDTKIAVFAGNTAGKRFQRTQT